MPDEPIPPPPTAAAMAVAHALLTPWRAITRPVFTGLDNLPHDGPVLIVGNHTTYGALDVPLILDHVYQRRSIPIRTLADRMHDRIPGWRDILRITGAVQGNQANARALLNSGAHVLVFPGGAREVNKRRGQEYQLLWERRFGFAKLAQEIGCPIVPLASVGADELYDIVIDADTRALKPLQNLIKQRLGRDDIFTPLGHGIGPTPLPKPQRFYFAFGQHVDAGTYRAEEITELREAVKTALETQIAALLTARDNPEPTQPTTPEEPAP